jgi:hypothetical protein
VQTPNPQVSRSTQDRSNLPFESNGLFGFPLGNTLHTQQCIHRSLWMCPRDQTHSINPNLLITQYDHTFHDFETLDFVTSPSEFLDPSTVKTQNVISFETTITFRDFRNLRTNNPDPLSSKMPKCQILTRY